MHGSMWREEEPGARGLWPSVLAPPPDPTALALSWSTMRPGPRRREPDVPAPAWQANWRRWR